MRSWRDLVVMFLLTIGTVILLLYHSNAITPAIAGPPALDSAKALMQPKPEQTLYGISLSSYQVTTGKVRSGESLAELLLPYHISMQTIYRISQLPDSLIDERKIKQGNRYAVFMANDSSPTYFVYEKDPLNYVVIGLTSDPIWARNDQKRIEHRIQFASGTIESSLWESMNETNANPNLALELSEIFAWSIDFFGVQQGDRYKVIYEESYVDSQSVGIHQILGAWFYHSGSEFWAIPFKQGGTRSFFDEEGNSLRKAFLKAPLRFSRISSRFSNSRLHPVLKIRRPHHGVDYAAPAGTPVVSVGDGVVTRKGFQDRGGGNFLTIKHNSVYSTTYMHLSRFGKGINQGVYVKQGDVIGYVGSTGLATGPHLDFRFYKNGRAVDPLKVEAPPVEPVEEENMPAFGITRSITMNSLKMLQ